jgi:hypothetical protein
MRNLLGALGELVYGQNAGAVANEFTCQDR